MAYKTGQHWKAYYKRQRRQRFIDETVAPLLFMLFVLGMVIMAVLADILYKAR